MTSRPLAAVLALLFVASTALAALPAQERKAIESLIAAVEQLDGASFVRNGKSYNPRTAAKFLRGKWDDRGDEIRTAEEFIVKVATRSSTTGRVYLVRFADGREIETAAFLRAELAKLR